MKSLIQSGAPMEPTVRTQQPVKRHSGVHHYSLLTALLKHGHDTLKFMEDFFIANDKDGYFDFEPQTERAKKRLRDVPRPRRGLDIQHAGEFMRWLKAMDFTFEGNTELKESSGIYGPNVLDWREL